MEWKNKRPCDHGYAHFTRMKPWDGNLRHNRSSPETSTPLGRASARLGREEVSGRRARDNFPPQRLG
ncbi:hypothetical protein EYF80_010222 [Liparis tanakae]|uniref:Uncharacterized protein n=1 Tax=Liparis tanakae TaxID=230148 RepID=A0A4Z2INJ9_9TELE|nr:hypothetical protein EYF80_010222 [Liparis tanakae]